MAEGLYNAEIWLPSEFISEDDVSHGHSSYMAGVKCFAGQNVNDSFHGFSSSGASSDMSSPVESVVGSTESDEEDYIAELTRRMDISSVHDDMWKVDYGFGCKISKAPVKSTSPQSTLFGAIGGCGCKQQGSSIGSPSCPSPPAEAKSNNGAWDLLYAAAGEVARMRMAEEGVAALCYNQNRGVLGQSRKPTPISLPPRNFSPSLDINPNPNFGGLSLSFQRLQAAQCQLLKHQQMMKQHNSVAWGQLKPVGFSHYQHNQTPQMIQNRARNIVITAGNMLAPSAWPTIQQPQHSGSSMRAPFLGEVAPKRHSAGTGVFLPRHVGTPLEPRKKPVAPNRVGQALNLNWDAIEAQTKIQTSFNPEYDAAALKYKNNVLLARQRSLGVHRPQPALSTELQLPQEWTY